MTSLFLAIERRTTAISLWCAVAMLLIAVGAGFYQVVSRFVIEQPAEWSEVTVRLALIWMVFLGAPIAFRQGAMMSVDLLYQLSRGRWRRLLETLILVAGLTLMGAILWWGQDYAWRTRFQTVPGMEWMTMSWGYAAMPVGAVFSILAIIGQWLEPSHAELDTAL